MEITEWAQQKRDILDKYERDRAKLKSRLQLFNRYKSLVESDTERLLGPYGKYLEAVLDTCTSGIEEYGSELKYHDKSIKLYREMCLKIETASFDDLEPKMKILDHDITQFAKIVDDVKKDVDEKIELVVGLYKAIVNMEKMESSD